MEFICDAPGGKSWFRIETAAEAAADSLAMSHAVEKFFLAEEDKATRRYRSSEPGFVEQEIGLKAHLLRSMPMFLTLRDALGRPLATAMLPANGRESVTFRPIIVGPANIDPYNIAMLLAWQSVGGFALGLALGWLVYQLLHSVDDYKIEVLLTMAPR